MRFLLDHVYKGGKYLQRACECKGQGKELTHFPSISCTYNHGKKQTYMKIHFVGNIDFFLEQYSEYMDSTAHSSFCEV